MIYDVFLQILACTKISVPHTGWIKQIFNSERMTNAIYYMTNLHCYLYIQFYIVYIVYIFKYTILLQCSLMAACTTHHCEQFLKKYYYNIYIFFILIKNWLFIYFVNWLAWISTSTECSLVSLLTTKSLCDHLTVFEMYSCFVYPANCHCRTVIIS